jgi:hypothetical protein
MFTAKQANGAIGRAVVSVEAETIRHRFRPTYEVHRGAFADEFDRTGRPFAVLGPSAWVEPTL